MGKSIVRTERTPVLSCHLDRPGMRISIVVIALPG